MGLEDFLHRKEGIIKDIRNRGFEVEEGGHAATRMLQRNVNAETVQKVYNEGRRYYDATERTWIRVKGNVAVVTQRRNSRKLKTVLINRAPSQPWKQIQSGRWIPR